MSILMLLALGGKKSLTPFTRTFNSNETWVAPAGLGKLDSAAGRGGPGQPGGSGQQKYSYETTVVFDLRSGGQESNSSSGSGTGPIPGPSGCTYTSTPDNTNYSGFTSCTFYTDTSDGGSPPTTGPSASITAPGFSRVFPGGTGGAGSIVTFNDVPVTGGTSYNVFVPTGGTITITWRL